MCGEERTEAARRTQSKSSEENVNLISASGITNCFSGGVTIIVGSQKRYLILLRPLLPTITTCFSSNSNDGSSLCKETTDKKLFKSYTPKSAGISSLIVTSARMFLCDETVLSVLPCLKKIP